MKQNNRSILFSRLHRFSTFRGNRDLGVFDFASIEAMPRNAQKEAIKEAYPEFYARYQRRCFLLAAAILFALLSVSFGLFPIMKVWVHADDSMNTEIIKQAPFFSLGGIPFCFLVLIPVHFGCLLAGINLLIPSRLLTILSEVPLLSGFVFLIYGESVWAFDLVPFLLMLLFLFGAIASQIQSLINDQFTHKKQV